MQVPLKQEKIQLPRHLAELSIGSGGLEMFEIDMQLNYLDGFKGY